MLRELEGRIAVVTGGSGGIGAAIVAALADRGATVVVFDLNAPERRQFRKVDLTSPDDVTNAVEEVVAEYGRIDVLVNCAGHARHEALEEITVDSWHEILEINLSAAFYASRAAAPHMRRHGWGRIVNIGSEQALQGDPNLCHYTAAKAGLVSLTRSFAVEYAPEVTVNLVSPGPTATTKFRRGPHFSEDRMARLPLKRFGTPEEVALSVAFVVGPGGDVYTGQQLDPNSGADLPMPARP
ncbi:SDR family NAD(P)-dependent oxidoreductase [Amycolatopsis jejuensis]|uniref:SDR family NAD(P)-dependent oxidoreductase n=1 Tax=Amycolatopsis jejuensis TaxID=330084 RepID=UPI000525D5B3|nr:SDR family oxidoreductase [Amycolatopsis jejuensis]